MKRNMTAMASLTVRKMSEFLDKSKLSMITGVFEPNVKHDSWEEKNSEVFIENKMQPRANV